MVGLVRERRLAVFAITDHDTTDGLWEAQTAAAGSPLLIPGIELSAEDDGQDVHVLGYFIRPTDAEFQVRLAHFRADRLNRGQRIVERLAALGLPVSWERVLALANGGAVGRPHIARALVEAGHVASLEDAFAEYLYTGGPAYVARQRLTPEAAIDLIHQAGGAAVLAHPGLVDGYSQMVERLAAAGLDGVEITHPKNDTTVRANLRALAARHDLIVTGGSDFHRPDRDQMGAYLSPPESVPLLRERAKNYG